MEDHTTEYNEIIHTKLLPVIRELFKDEFNPTSFIGPTQHLNEKLKQIKPFVQLEEGFTSVYKIADFNRDYQVVLCINPTSFQLLIVPLANYNNTPTTTNISCSADRSKKMYIYGIKANGEGPKVSGNALNRSIMDICKAMRIPQLYISDSAGIRCHWNPRIEIQHFSLIRVIIGKPTFYSSLPGHFYNEDGAMSEIAMLQDAIPEEDKAYIRHYLQFTPTAPGDDCTRINAIIAKGMELNPVEIFRFVATPYVPTGGRRRKKTRRVRRKRKYTNKIIR
jgi:hypothetical protein